MDKILNEGILRQHDAPPSWIEFLFDPSLLKNHLQNLHLGEITHIEEKYEIKNYVIQFNHF